MKFCHVNQSIEHERRCPSRDPRGRMWWSVTAAEASRGAPVQPCLQSHGDLPCATNFNPEESVPKFTSLGKRVAPALDNRHE